MMRFDMYSPSKKLDKELLLEISEMIEVLVSVGTKESIDLAERFGENYLELENKIKTYAYSEADKYWVN